MTPRLIRIAVAVSIAAVLLALASPAFAASEQGDAGDLRATAQDLGDEAVTTITGTYLSAADADMYRICLTEGHSFSASTVGGTSLDTQLFLLTAEGLGVYANDDWQGMHGSKLPANHRFSPTTGGVHYLAISSFNKDPKSAQGEIFTDSFNLALYPDEVLDANGFGAALPHDGWHGRESGQAGSYTISLTGGRVCPPPDTTAPTVKVDSPLDGGVYGHGESVAADYSCVDEPGGSGVASCAGPVADAAAVDTTTLGKHTFVVNAKDNAGNESSATATYTVVDTTPPSIAVSAPADGAVYLLGQHVLAAYSCEDQAGGSGLAACSGPAANGAPIDTSTVGTHSFEVRAADNAGNAASRTVSYSVVYDFDGFFSPVQNPPKWTRWKAGVPVPIRFALGGYHGPRPEAAGYPQSRPCGGGDAEQVTRVAKKKPVFNYERRSGRYSLLWKTERRWARTCREFVLKLDDGSVYTARFQFTKRGHRNRGDE